MKQLLVVAVLGACAALPLYAQERGEEVVLVRINDKVITRHEVDKFLVMSGEPERIARTYHGAQVERELEKAFKKAVAFLIEEVVVDINAQTEGIVIEDTEKKRAEEIFKENAKHFGTEANYELVLKERGLSGDDIKERIRRQLFRQRYLRQKLSIDVFVSPKEARRYYEENKPSFARRETVTVRQIVIKFGNGNRTRDTALKLIGGIKANLDEGADFESLARKFSEGVMKDEGGLWPPAPIADLRANIAKAVAGLKQGELSDVIEREDDLILVKVEKKDDAPYEPFETALEGISEELKKLKREKKFPELEKELYTRVEIELVYDGASIEELCPIYVKVKGRRDENGKDQIPNDE